MQAHDQELVPHDVAISGIRRRRFLSVGGGALAGAGALTLARPTDADAAPATPFAAASTATGSTPATPGTTPW